MTAKEVIRLRYDGPAVDDHYIDVRDLAPALLALGDLCIAANKKLNGTKSAIRVFVSAEPDQNCFEINIQFLQEVFGVVRSILDKDEVSTLKEILEWLDLTTAGGAVGLFGLLRVMAGKKVEAVKTIQKADGKNFVQLAINGDVAAEVNVNVHVWDLANDSKVVREALKVLQPATKKGIDQITFEDSDGKKTISSEDARLITSSYVPAIALFPDIPDEQELVVWASAYGVVFDAKAENWRFDWGDGHKYVDISKTTIAADALRRRMVSPEDRYRLRIKVIQETSPQMKIRYEAIEVLDFVPAPQQGEIFE